MYKLLLFNQDFADELNVPAIACFTELEFENWKISKLGEEDLNYELKLSEYQKKVDAWNNFNRECTKRDLWHRAPETEEEKQWIRENMVDYVSDYDKPKKGKSYLIGYLGNYGDEFSEDYDNYLTGQDFIDANIVLVYDVSEDFYETFKRVGLENLSLCNVFNCNIHE